MINSENENELCVSIIQDGIMIKLCKNETSEEEAELWYNDTSTLYNEEEKLILGHINFDNIKAIYDRTTEALEYFVIDLQQLKDSSNIIINTGNKSLKLSMDYMLKDICLLNEYVPYKRESLLNTDYTYNIADSNNNIMKLRFRFNNINAKHSALVIEFI